jgi:hypothetical protein
MACSLAQYERIPARPLGILQVIQMRLLLLQARHDLLDVALSQERLGLAPEDLKAVALLRCLGEALNMRQRLS